MRALGTNSQKSQEAGGLGAMRRRLTELTGGLLLADLQQADTCMDAHLESGKGEWRWAMCFSQPVVTLWDRQLQPVFSLPQSGFDTPMC